MTMAVTHTNPIFIFTLLFSLPLFTSVVLSRTISTTSVLDVSSLLQQTLDILSYNPQTQLQPFAQETISPFVFNSSSSFSLPLHSRETISKTQHNDYKTLLHSQLNRDSARVNSLVTKLKLALKGVNKKELKTVDNQMLTVDDLSTPVVSGESQGSGEYFSRVGIGSPPRQFYMVIDTGSDVNWIQCEPCVECYDQPDPIYDPSSSSSSHYLSCDSPQCDALDMSACSKDSCIYQVSYGDGSFTFGNLMTETVTFDDSRSIQNIAIGCGHDNEGLFAGSAGLIGLGGGSLSLTNQLNATSFSYCLVDRNSKKSSTLDFNSPIPRHSVTSSLSRSSKADTFYYVGLTGLSVGGKPVQISSSIFKVDESGNGGIIVDCGTAVTRLQTEAYNALRDAFLSQTKKLKSTYPYALFDTCYDFSGLSSVKVPTVSFIFSGGKYLDLPAKNYLIPVDSEGTVCFAFAPTDSSPQIIGNVQQQGTRVTYDLSSNVVGFTSHEC